MSALLAMTAVCCDLRPHVERWHSRVEEHVHMVSADCVWTLESEIEVI